MEYDPLVTIFSQSSLSSPCLHMEYDPLVTVYTQSSLSLPCKHMEYDPLVTIYTQSQGSRWASQMAPFAQEIKTWRKKITFTSTFSTTTLV